MKHGDNVTFKKIPVDYKYTVTEAAEANYTTTSANATNVVIPLTTVPAATFTNTYVPDDRNAAFTNTPVNTDTGIIKTSVSTDTDGQLYDWVNNTTEYKSAHETAVADYNHMFSKDYLDAVFNIKVYDRNNNSTLVYEATYHPKTYAKVNNKWQARFDLTDTSTRVSLISGNIDRLFVGDKVVITETVAPKGYMLPSQATAGASNSQTLAVLSKDASKNVVTFEDKPAYDLADLQLYKYSTKYVNGKPQIDTSQPVRDTTHYAKPMGSVFLVSYYDNDSCTGTPVRYWYLMTDENGELHYNNTHLIGGDSGINFNDPAFYDKTTLTAQIPAGYNWANKGELYKSPDGECDLPLGSIAIQEVWSPAGYELIKDNATNKPFIFKKKITQDSNGVANSEWITQPSEFTSGIVGTAYVDNNKYIVGDAELDLALKKTDSATGKLLGETTFTITDVNESAKVYRYTTSATDEYHIVKDFLELGHTYVLEEVAFADGYVLNEDKVTFYVDENGDFHFENYTDRFGAHTVAPVTHKLESGTEDGSAETVDYVVKKTGSTAEDYEITYDTALVDENDRIGQNGDPCYIFYIKNDPNVLKLTKTDEDGNPLKGVTFEFKAESLPDNDTTTVIAYRDKNYTQPFKNGDTLTTDEKGEAYLYRLNTKVTKTTTAGVTTITRGEESYIITETKTAEGKQLLTRKIVLNVTAKGRIYGTLQKTINRTRYQYEGNETRKDGNIHYVLNVKNGETITLATGGTGTMMIYLVGGLLAAGIAVMLGRSRRKNVKQAVR